MSRLNKQKGFTLLEMIVAIGIFTIVMLIGVTALITTVQAHRKSAALQTVLQGLEFSLDSIARGVRTGTIYHCGDDSLSNYDVRRDCDLSAAESTFAFEKDGGDIGDGSDQVVYQLASNRIERSTDGGSTFSPVTSPNVTINTLIFGVHGAPAGDVDQPRVLIYIAGHAGPDQFSQTEFQIQTTITQRELDS